MRPKIVPIAVVSLLLGLGFDWLFYGKVPGISVFIYASLILGLTLYLARLFRQPLNRSIYWLIPVILFFAGMVLVRAKPLLIVMDIFLVLYLLLVVARLGSQPQTTLSRFQISEYFSLVGSMPLRIIGEFLQVLQKTVSRRGTKASSSLYIPIVRGVIFSLPILFVFLLLLSSADLVFQRYITSLFDPDISGETIFRLGLIGFVISMFLGAFALIFMPVSTPKQSAEMRKKFDLGATEASIILGSVGLLFFVFVIIQLAYLFGGLEHLTASGYTYAEYARKGFFELIAVAMISLALIWNVKRYTGLRATPQTRVFKWLSALLIVEVIIIMLSAHNRLNLYEEAYGFTTLRLLSHLFILWLAFAFVLLLTYILREKRDQYFVFPLFISMLCFFVVFNLINPDAFIARQNIQRFNDTGKIDLAYLGGLSEDAAPEVAKLLDHKDKKLREGVANILYQHSLGKDQTTSWQSANLARHRASQISDQKASQIQAGKLYVDYQKVHSN